MNRFHYGPQRGHQQVIAASILDNKTQVPRHLSPTHWGELVEESGITPAIAAANFRSFGALPFADPENERQTLLAKRFTQLNPQPGHSFQARLKLQQNYRHLDAGGWRFIGDALPGYQPTPRWKADNPRVDKKGRAIKYEAQPGRRPGLLLPQVPVLVWRSIAERYGLQIPADRSAGFWAWVLDNPALPLTIAEGEKKACAMLGQGLIAVGLAGKDLGRQILKDEDQNKAGECLIAELQALAEGGRLITICFDADPKPATARSVKRSAMRLGHALEKAGADVRLAQLALLQGQKCGPDDLLVALGADALLDAIADALSLGESAWLARYWAERRIQPTITASSMDEAELPLEPVVAIRVPKGGGKSKAADRWMAERPQVVAPTHRRSLGASMASRMDLVWLNSLDKRPGGGSFIEGANGEIQLWEHLPPRLSLCLDSLLVIRPQDYAGLTLVIDEAEQALNHLLTSSTCRERRGLLIQRLQQLVSYSAQVVLMDADLSDATIEWFRKAKAGAPVALLVAPVASQSWPVHLYEQSRPELAQSALLAAAAAGPVFISTDSRERAAALHDLLQHHLPQAKGVLITSETTGDPEVKAWQESLPDLQALAAGAIQWVVASPSISSGISIEHNYFQSVWGFYGAGTMDDAEALQALARVRPPVPRHVWVSPIARPQQQPLSTAWWPQQVEADLRRSWNDQSALMRRELQPDLLLEPEIGACAEQFAATVSLWADLQSRRNYSLAHLKAFIKARLIHEGHAINSVIAGLAPDIQQELKTLKAQLKSNRQKLHAAAIVAAPIIGKAEADRQRRLQQNSPALQRRSLVERLALKPEELTPELVLWGEQWAGAAERLALLLEPALAISIDAQRLKATTHEGIAPLPWDQSFKGLRQAASEAIGLRAFIEAFPFTCRLWDKDTLAVKELAEKARKYRLIVGRCLGLTIKSSDTDVALVGALLRSYGITTTASRRGSEARMYGGDSQQLRVLRETANRLRRKLSAQAPPIADKSASLNKTACGGAPIQASESSLKTPQLEASFDQLAIAINGYHPAQCQGAAGASRTTSPSRPTTGAGGGCSSGAGFNCTSSTC